MQTRDPDALKDVLYRDYILRAEAVLDAYGKECGYQAVWTRPDMNLGRSEGVRNLAVTLKRECKK